MTACRFTMFRLWVLLLLAMIGLQAAEPVRTPLQRESGSAFSAATSDVALLSTRRDIRMQAQAVSIPATPVSAAVPVDRRGQADFLVQPALPWPQARAPPPRASSERVPDLRGPPVA